VGCTLRSAMFLSSGVEGGSTLRDRRHGWTGDQVNRFGEASKLAQLADKIREYGAWKSFRYSLERVRLLFSQIVRRSYSQYGEDLVIDDLSGHKKRGFYVDVGAGDPIWFSNSKRFYRRGWDGINIEPDQRIFSRLAGDRPRDINVNLAVGSSNSTTSMYRFAATHLSTLSREKADSCRDRGFRPTETVRVEVRTLSDILEQHCGERAIDFMSVDTEGLELEALKGNDWCRFRPKVLCVETAPMLEETGGLQQ